jgi:ATP-dependent DNA helicase RecG
MRELGEGMRRIYELMHRNELAPPILNSSPDGFNITLTHRPLYSSKDLLWLSQFEQFELDREQKSVILLGQEARIFSAQEVWDAVGIVDTEHYRKLIASLTKINILKSSIGKDEARRLATKTKTPIRQFPRFEIVLPKAGEILAKTHKLTGNVRPEKVIVSNSVHTLFVSNIPINITKSEIFDAMSFFGTVANIHFPLFKERNKGYCFVEFESNSVAEKVLSSEEPIKLKDKSLVIRIATPRKPS